MLGSFAKGHSAVMIGVLFKHCKDAESTGQIDMNSDHKAAIARIELPIDDKTQRTKTDSEKMRGSEDRRDNWSAHDRRSPNTPRTLNRTNPNTTAIPETLEELNGKLEDAMTNSTSTTKHEQPHDITTTTNEHAEALRQNRISTQHQQRQTDNKRRQQDDQ